MYNINNVYNIIVVIILIVVLDYIKKKSNM